MESFSKAKSLFTITDLVSVNKVDSVEVEYQILVDTSSVEAFNMIKDGSANYGCGTE